MTDTLDEAAVVPMPDLAFGLADPREAARMTGLEQIEAIVERRFPAPPIVEVMAQWIHEIGEGHIVFLGNPASRYLNPMGLVHGGWTMTLLDSALGCAVQTTLGRGETYASLGTEVKFIRPVLPGMEQVRCRAEVQSRGRATATAAGWVEDGRGRVLATGTSTCFIHERKA
ncbi:PaaI family thioesterase [Breoghania sp.]|uniref:PaaI family thioesterase n=1 Tax=Breoghania sp. TaxID=2065378 RepID=UPI002AA7F5AC|nr:PaaI family thioesterase [Breoghania sp.]